MKNQINSILTVFSILALIAIAVSGIFLVLDLGSGPEIKEALEKIIYILGILLVLSFVITSITKIKNTKDKGFGLIGILVVVGILIAGGYYYYSRSERAKEINDAEVNFLKKQGQTSLDL